MLTCLRRSTDAAKPSAQAVGIVITDFSGGANEGSTQLWGDCRRARGGQVRMPTIHTTTSSPRPIHAQDDPPVRRPELPPRLPLRSRTPQGQPRPSPPVL